MPKIPLQIGTAMHAAILNGPERLSYDVQERAIYDENGLRVASEVNGRDAALFIFADRLRASAQEVLDANGGNPPMFMQREAETLEEVLDSITAYQGKAAEDSAREEIAAPGRYQLIAEALAYQGADFEADRPVDGGDMVEFFADWRQRMKATFGDNPPSAVSVDAEARRLVSEAKGLIEEALTTHIYDVDNGDEIPADCSYSAFINGAGLFLDGTTTAPLTLMGAVRQLYTACGEEGSDEEEAIAELPSALNDALAQVIRFATEPVTPAVLWLEFQGCALEGIYSTVPLPGLTVNTYDRDIEGIEREKLTVIRDPDDPTPGLDIAFVVKDHEVTVCPPYIEEPAGDPKFDADWED